MKIVTQETAMQHAKKVATSFDFEAFENHIGNLLF